jgi:peptidoglycan/LPS O-acetylase OafA/YrhL
MNSPNASYIAAVDHLRAIAAFLVILHHGHLHIGGRLVYETPNVPYRADAVTPLDALIVDGHTGVSLFMVLSGFIFTHIALGRGVRFLPFMANRVLRIYPLMLFLFVLAWFMRPQFVDWTGLVAVLLIPFNLQQPVDLWFVPSVHPFTALFWTIAVEFKFYLLFPAILLVVNRYGARGVVAMLAGAIVLRTLLVLGGANAHDVAYFSIFGRIDQFLLGAGAALAYRRVPRGRGGAICAVSFAAVAILIYAYNQAGSQPAQGTWKILWPTVEGLAWAAFIVGYLDFAGRVDRWLAGALAFMGKVSFSVYLVHLIAISAVLRSGPVELGLGPTLDALAYTLGFVLPATLAVSWVTFHAIEQPFLRLRVRYLRDDPARRGEAAGAERPAGAEGGRLSPSITG